MPIQSQTDQTTTKTSALAATHEAIPSFFLAIMEAFIPCGAPLASSRSFLTGDQAPVSQPNGTKRNVATMRFTGLKKLVTEKTLRAPTQPANVPYEQMQGAFAKFYNPETASYQFQRNAKGQCATPYDVRCGPEGVKPENARDNDQGGFRNMDLFTDDLVHARPGWSSDEARTAVNVAFRNIFGNANLFESEVAEFAKTISCVYETADMREFVRALGLSSRYRKLFFEGCSNMRFVELSFKHFLGRAPYNQAEVSAQIQILTTQGYNAAINAIIDSDEYDRLFGKSRLPAVNFRGGHQYNDGMNKTAVLNGSFLTSDRLNTKAFLQTGDSPVTSFGVLKGLPEAWRGENGARAEAGPIMSFPDSFFWNAPPTMMKEAEDEWKLRYGKWFPFWYKDSAVYKDVMKPVLNHSQEEQALAADILKRGSTMAKSYQYVK